MLPATPTTLLIRLRLHLLPVLTRLPASATLRTPSPTTLLVWHYRTCHIPLRLLKRMAKEQSVLGLHIVLKHSEEFPCVACLKGKLTAPHLTPAGPKPRRSALRVSEQTLSRASLDAFGPLRCRGFDRSLYIIVIILADSNKALFLHAARRDCPEVPGHVPYSSHQGD